MEFLLDIIKILLPSGLVFATAFYLVKKFLDAEDQKRQAEKSIANQNLVTPIRLQAYERVILFLERISPNSLISRTYKSGMSSRLLHSELLKTIRNEFEHNLSQQIYMSVASWDLTVTAKEEVIRIINIASSKITSTADGIELSQSIIKTSAELRQLPTQLAIDYLKKEVVNLF